MSTTSTVLRQTHDEVLKDAEGNVMLFRGLILRHQLTVLLKNKVFFHESKEVRRSLDGWNIWLILRATCDYFQSQKEIDLLTLNQEYPRYPDIASVDISEDERTMLMVRNIMKIWLPLRFIASSSIREEKKSSSGTEVVRCWILRIIIVIELMVHSFKWYPSLWKSINSGHSSNT